MESRPSRSGPTTRWLPWALLALVPGLYLAHAAHFFHYVNDDAYITFRYSRALVEGRGPYFNPGERVEGYTNFLQMLIAAGTIVVAGADDAPGVMKVLGVLWGALTLALAFTLTRRILKITLDGTVWPDVGALTAGLLAASSPGFSINSTSGLETTLFAFTIALGVWLGMSAAADGKWRGAGIAFAAAALTRPEGAVVFACYWVGSVLATPSIRSDAAAIRRHVLDGAIVTAAFGGHLLLRYVLYDGEWLPNTYYAKAGGFWGFDSWNYLWHGATGPLGSWLGLLAAVAGWTLASGIRRISIPLLATAVGGALLPLITGTDWMMGWRLAAPYVPLLAAVAVIGWCHLARRVLPRPALLAPILVLLAVPVAWFSQSADRRQLHDRSEVRARGYLRGHTALADWLCEQAAGPGTTVALMDIGIVGYRCMDLTILDVTGLTDRHIAKSPGPFLRKRYDLSYVFDRRPEFIVLTLGADGDASREPPSSLRLHPWTPVEAEIARDPAFRSHYVRPVRPGDPEAPWPDRLAVGIGATRAFLHDYPGRYYLLTVFRRRGP